MQSQRDAEIRAELAMGLEIIPTGLMHQDNASAYLLEEYWARPGSMASAVELVRRNGWAGLGLDNEASAQGDARLPGKLASFIGNLSAALHGSPRLCRCRYSSFPSIFNEFTKKYIIFLVGNAFHCLYAQSRTWRLRFNQFSDKNV